MQTMTVGELKAHFSDALDMVQKGEDVIINFGKRREKIAVLVPFSHYQGKPQRRLGLGQARRPLQFGRTLPCPMKSCSSHELSRKLTFISQDRACAAYLKQGLKVVW